MSDAERVAADEPLCDCCQKPCYPIKADWGGYFCGKCYQYVKRMYCKLADVRTEIASVTARLAAAEATLSHARSFVYQQDDGEVVRISAKGTFSTVKTWMIWHSKHDWLPNSQHDTLDAAIAAAVSAGWMKPLGEGGGE